MLRKQNSERNPKSAFRGEAISLDTEEEIFYIPKSALYNSNVWETGLSGPSAPSGPSGTSWTPVPPGARLVTWRPDMNKKKKKIEEPPRQRYQPITPARKRLVTWVPRMVTGSTEVPSGYHRQSLGMV